MDRATFLKSCVLNRWSYVTPVQTAAKIRTMHTVCKAGPYLDCVLEYAHVTKITSDFATLHKLPELSDPDVFLAAVDTMITS